MTVTNRMRISTGTACASLMLLAASIAHAQLPAPPPSAQQQRFDIVLTQGGGPNVDPLMMPGMAGGVALDFSATPFAFDQETVVGAPYSAESVTEVIQTLVDGNRIVRGSSAAVYRDSLGRTRREQGLAVLGAMVGGPDHRRVQIMDPEAGVNFSLDLQARTAYKMPVPRIMVDPAAPPANPIGLTFQVALAPPPAGGVPGDVFFRKRLISGEAPVVEQLGTQLIEGVTAEGLRSTTTIPAGAIGNEQPIRIVSERWTSPELKVLVMSRQADPRFGETTYRLTNIVRAEPPADLFQVPPDFTVLEGQVPQGVTLERMKVIEKLKK